MAELRFNLNELYQRAFGLVRLPYPTLVAESGNFINDPVQTVRSLTAKSAFGTELVFPLVVGRSLGANEYQQFQFPNEPVFLIEGSKTIIETPINRGVTNGMVYKQNVLEEFNLNNYRVRIRGLIINEEEPETYPSETVARMKDFFEHPGSIDVVYSDLLIVHKIFKLAFQRIKWVEVVGNPEVQGYEIDCLSDQDFDLEYVEDATAQ
jgi:hypothetical protein